MKDKIYIHELRALSNQGLEVAGKQHSNLKPLFREKNGVFGGHLPESEEWRLDKFNSNKLFRRTDRTVKMLLAVAESLKQDHSLPPLGIQVASSRGASQKWEEEFGNFLNTNEVNPACSPITSLGNIGSNLAQYLNLEAPISENSITCSSAGMSLMNAIAWLNAGFRDDMLIGASEACLSPFTQAQMNALGIASPYINEEWPCKAMDLNKEKNSMVLGEAAALMLCSNKAENAIGSIASFGWGLDNIKHPSFIDPKGKALQESMKMALSSYNKPIDLVIAHAPGTILGDLAEQQAVEKAVGKQCQIISNKTVYGHGFSCSLLLNLMTFFDMATKNTIPPGFLGQEFTNNQGIRNALVNCIGFGGQAISVIAEIND